MAKKRRLAVDMKYHYTYRITNIKERMYYYGVHSCDCLPKEDIGVKYWSSSKRDGFVEHQKQNPEQYKYKVIKIFNTRIEAVVHEMFLHSKFDVKLHEKFYNDSNQTSTGFDTTGVKFSDEINKSKGRPGNGSIKPGMVMVKENNNSFMITKEEFDKGMYDGVPKNTVLTKEKGYVTKEEFQKGNLTSIHSKSVTIIEDGVTRRISKEEFDKGGYIGVNTNMAVCKDINSNIFQIDKNNIDLLKGIIGGSNCKDSYIVTDNNGVIHKIVSIGKFANYYNLPVNKLIKNADKGIIKYVHDRKMKNLTNINGWKVEKIKSTSCL